MRGMENRESVLRNVLEPIRDNYDYIIIDCPPALGLSLTNAIIALDAGKRSSFVIIPVAADGAAVAGIMSTIGVINSVANDRREKPHKFRLLWTLVSERSVAFRNAQESIQQYIGEVEKMKTHISARAAVQNGSTIYEPVVSYAPKCKTAKDYDSLAEEIIRRCEA